MNGQGDVVLDTMSYDPSGPFGTWAYRDGLGLAAAIGQPVPGGGGGLVFKSLTAYTMLSESRHVAFAAATGVANDSSNSWAIWTDRRGTLEKIYAAGDPAPSPVSNLSLSGAYLRAMTPDDRLVFTTTLSGPGVTWRNDDAVFAERNGQLKLIAREGDPAPDTPTGVVFVPYSLDSLRATADGRVSLRGGLSGPGVTADNDMGIWSEASGELRLINRKGDPAPGAGAGMSFGGTENVAPAFNNKGQTVFKSALRGPGALGIGTESVWLDDNGTKTLLARLGDHAPGFGPDTHYTSFQDYTLGINNLGDIVLEGQVYGPDAQRFPLALWFIHDGQPQLFMQQDGYFDGQLVSGFGATEPNNLGQVRIAVVFAGPDGIQETADDLSAFYLVTIPEPATLALFALGAATMLRRKRR